MGAGIEVQNLNAWYGSTHTLHNITLKIPANQATALIGPSGCGKSTFVRCLNRMHETNPIARVTGSVSWGSGYLWCILAGSDSPPHWHGISAAKSVSDHVDLRQRGDGLEFEWHSESKGFSMKWWSGRCGSSALWEEVKDI